MPKGNYKRSYRKRPAKRVYQSKAKKLVTGHGPTLLERIAAGAGQVGTLAKAIMPVVAAINTEQKFVDINQTGNPTVVAPLFLNFSALAQGTDEQNRIGNSILAKNLQLKFSMTTTWAAADAVGTAKYRVVIFADKSQAGTPPVLADLMQSTTLFNSAFNKNNTDRFVIMKDKHYVLNRPDSGAVGYSHTMTHKFFKALNFHIRYIGTSAANASMGQNQIYAFVWYTSSSATITSAFSVYSRLNFTDN